MKVLIDFIGTEYVGKKIDVLDQYLWKLDGESAMMILFNQEYEPLHKDHNLLIVYERTDIPYTLKTCGSRMSVNVFASPKLKWYCIDKEYVQSVLEGKTNDN